MTKSTLFRCLTVFVVVFTSAFNGFSQSCETLKLLRPLLEKNLDSKQKDSILYYLNQIPKTPEMCNQEYLVYKTRSLFDLKQIDSASVYLLKLSKSLHTFPNKLIKPYELYLKGKKQYYANSNDSAFYYYLKSYELSKDLKDTLLLIKSSGSLSNVFANLSQFEKAVNYSSYAIQLSRRIGNKSSEILLLGNLFTFYGKLFLVTTNKMYLDSARHISLFLVKEAKKNKRTYELLKAYSGLGSCYFQDENYNLTLRYSDSIIQIADKQKHALPICQAYANMCDSYLALQQFNKAKTAADSAMLYAKKINDKITISEVYYKLFDCENELKNYKAALNYYIRYTELQDSIKSEEQFSIINELEQKYNKSENERTINNLTQEQQISDLKIKILVVTIALFFILVLLAIFIYRQRNLKQKQNLLETEHRLNRVRINPHFFFNSLTTLQGMALKESDGKKTYTNLYLFSKLMRQTLESSYSDLTSVSKELEYLTNYVELQKLNLHDKFSFKVTVQENLDTERIMIPSMILQPFIENSIEHGFSDIETGGLIHLNIETKNEELAIVIQDNGKGIQKETTRKKEHTSRAMQITSDRLFLLNKIHKSNARFLINNGVSGGIQVEIFLPLQRKNESTGN